MIRRPTRRRVDYYYFPNSHWSRAISMVLHEKQLSPKRHFVDIRRNASFEPDYVKLNPKGVVPTLVDGGRVVCNSPRIAEYLDEHCPTPPLLQGHPQKELVAAWSRRLEELPVMLLSYSVWVLGKRGERSADILADKVTRAEQYSERYPELRQQYERKAEYFRAFRAQVYDDEYVAKRAADSQWVLDEVAELVENQSWIGGDTLSFADCIAASTLYRFRDLGKLDAWSKDPRHPLFAYMRRMEARPSFQYVYVEDELIPR